MSMRALLSCWVWSAFLLAVGTGFAPAQSAASLGIVEWRSLTSLLDARDVVADRHGNLWIATSGGIYVCDPQSGNILAEYRPGEGLLALEFTSIAVSDGGDTIVAGAADGTIEVLTSDNGPLRSLTDIRRAVDQYPRRTINGLLIRNGRIYAATDFGIVVYDLRQGVPIETADVIANFAPKSPIAAIAFRGDTLLVAGENGVAAIWLGRASLRDRRWWRVIPLRSTAQWSGSAVSMTFDAEGQLVVATQSAILAQREDSLEMIWQRPPTWSDALVGLSQFGGQIILSSGRGIYRLDGTMLGPTQPSVLRRHRTVMLPGGAIVVGCTASNGITLLRDSTLVSVAPTSMLANTAYDLAVDTSGNLWVATASGGRGGSGFACRIGGRWYTFAPQLDPRVPTVNYYHVGATPSGDVWLSSWGAGMLRAWVVGGDSIALEYYNDHNSPLVGFPGNASYTVPGSIVGDRSGTVWIAHWGNWIQSSSHIIARDPSGRFYGFTYPGNPPGVGYLMYIALDAAGTKWLGSYRSDADGSGLVWFNDNGTLEDPRDDRWGRLTAQGTALPSNTITALALDRTGMLWVGTSAGVATIVNPITVLSGGTPFVRTVRELRGVAINAIAVDALDNKWIATSNGIWIIADDGITVLGTITQAQYPVLLSNDVRALAPDLNRGIMYIGTERGINAVQTIAVQPLTDYRLHVYPQPFNPDRQVLTVEGLAADTELRISTISGMTVRTIRTRSRVTLWDGRDDSGVVVPSGVYLLHAVSEQAGGNAVTKVAVVRSRE
ncbi:MAG: hypothetical protein N2663_02090 [Chlorobi bacterium]|nr:hypothetical protein [Chlorobiota bacterium]